MPRLPRYAPQIDVPSSVPYGQASGAAWAAPYAAAGTGLEAVSKTLGDLYQDYQREQAKLQAAESTVLRENLIGSVKDQYAGAELEARGSGMAPEQYEATVRGALDNAVNTALERVPDPMSKALIGRELAQWKAGKVVEARTHAFKARVERVQSLSGEQLEGYANEAIFGSEATAQPAYTKGLTLIRDLVATGVYSGEQGKGALSQYNERVGTGTASRWFKNPTLRESVLKQLNAGEWIGIPADKQPALAESLVKSLNAARLQAKDEARSLTEEAERRAVLAIRDATTPEELVAVEQQVREWAADRLIAPSSERLEHLLGVIDKKRNPPGVDDRGTTGSLQTAIWRADTAAAIDDLQARADAALAAGKLTDGTHRTYVNELDQRRQRLKGGQVTETIKEAHNDIQSEIRALRNLRGMMDDKFGSIAAPVVDQAQQELDRESAFTRGKEHPRDWWNRRRSYYVARLGDVANTYASGVEGGIPAAYRPVGLDPNKVDVSMKLIDQGIAKLLKDRSKMTDDEYRAIGRSFQDLARIYVQFGRLKGEQTTADVQRQLSSPPAAGKRQP